LIAYIPYYLSWPLVMLLLDLFPENRGFILGISSLFNGVNTILLTIFIDPKLSQIGNYKRIVSNIYIDIIEIRILSSLIAFFILFLVSILI